MGLRVALICLAGLSAAPAGAYVRGRAASGAPLQWSRTSCITLRANAAGSDDVDDGSDLEAVTRAVQTWQQATAGCAYLTWVLREPSAAALPAFDENGANENTISWIEEGWPYAPEYTALTIVNKRTTGEILDADVLLNGEHHTFSTDGTPGTRDIESVLAHELGHVLGLDHPCDGQGVDHEGRPVPTCATAPTTIREALMYPRSAAGTLRRAPQPDDVLGACSIYPLARDPQRCATDPPSGCACALGDGAAAPCGGILALAVLAAAAWRRRSTYFTTQRPAGLQSACLPMHGSAKQVTIVPSHLGSAS